MKEPATTSRKECLGRREENQGSVVSWIQVLRAEGHGERCSQFE